MDIAGTRPSRLTRLRWHRFLQHGARLHLYFRILAAAGATNLSLVTFLLPVSALALGAAFLGEAVTGRTLIGMALIGLGLVALDGRLPNQIRRSTRPRHVVMGHDDHVI